MNKFNGETYGNFNLPVRKMKKIYIFMVFYLMVNFNMGSVRGPVNVKTIFHFSPGLCQYTNQVQQSQPQQ